jgi:hypothetical protein
MFAAWRSGYIALVWADDTGQHSPDDRGGEAGQAEDSDAESSSQTRGSGRGAMGLMPDFVLDFISVNTFWSILFTIHALLAVALLGALTHQAMSVLMPVRAAASPGGFVTRFRAVQGAGYAGAVCVLWIVTFFFGAWIYTKYRMYVRIPIEQEEFWKTQGFFELKEHLASIVLGLLPIYWYLWKNARNSDYDSARKWLTVVIAAFCWFIFLTGHIVNNVRGFGS